MQRLDQTEDEAWLSALVYGKSGSGKTTLGVSAPRPLHLLSERQGMLAIRQAAARLGVAVPPVIFMETLDDCRAVLRALRGPKTEPFRTFEYIRDADGNAKRDHLGHAEREITFELPVEAWPETVVVDSMSDVMRLVEEEIRRQSPPKMGKDGLPVDSERYWNVLGDRCKNVIFGLRDAPVHKLFLCQEDDREVGEGEDKRRSIQPAMPMRKLPAVLSGAVNLTAYAYRREVRPDPEAGKKKEIQISYGVMTVGPEYLLLKPCRPLRNHEVADFGLWVQAIRGALKTPLPTAPAPSSESLAATVSGLVVEAKALAQQALEEPAEAKAAEQAAEDGAQAARDLVGSAPAPAARTRKKRGSK